MSSRFASAAKLTARLATTGIRSRVQAAKSFSLPRAVASPIASGRLFSTSPFPASPVPSNLESLGSSEPTLAEEQVKADSEDTVDPLAEEPHHAAAAAAPVEGNCSVFVGGLSWNIDNDWLQAELEKQLDTTDGVISVKVARTNMGKSKGFAFIDFATPALANAATELQIDLDGRTPEFRLSTPSPPRSDRPERTNRDDRPAREVRSASDGPRNPPSTTVWVGNVAWAVEEADIEDTFSRFGTVIRVSMPKDQESGRSRGIAYVEYADVDMAMNALASSTAEGLELEGRALRLDYAEVKSTSSFGSRGGAGGRGGFGGGRGGGRGGFGGRDGGSRGGYGGGGDRNGGGGGGYGGGRDGGGGGGYGGRGGSSGGRRGDDRASSQTVW